tara:strand:+ start:2714 stop:3907 length:1194 start_codon:yes stop_codon:yes gene_type:complete
MFTLNDNKIKILVGVKKINVTPITPFDKNVLNFLSDFSKKILTYEDINKFPDLLTFGFWCRRKNLEIKKKAFLKEGIRIGYGLAFHIVPSNIPINFLYSFIFGLLSGNSNIIRMPTILYSQSEIAIKILNNLLNKKKYKQLKLMNSFIQYNHDKVITDLISKNCNARIIWGGDKTINKIIESKISHRTIEIKFSDRYSVAIINSNKIIRDSKLKIRNLAKHFYNDTYLVDQNACSSPHIIFWTGNHISKAKKIFWKQVEKLVKDRFEFKFINTVDRITLLQNNAIKLKKLDFAYYSPYLARININKINDITTDYRGYAGVFFEFSLLKIDDLKKVINPKFQTISYFGIDKNEIQKLILNNNLTGVDRIVPIGKALNIDLTWDGIDIVNKLSRIISTE